MRKRTRHRQITSLSFVLKNRPKSFTPKRHRQMRVKDLPEVPMRWLDPTNPWLFGRKALNLPMGHHASIYQWAIMPI